MVAGVKNNFEVQLKLKDEKISQTLSDKTKLTVGIGAYKKEIERLAEQVEAMKFKSAQE